MAGFIVVHVKITDDKKDGIVFHGPHTSEIMDTKREAEAEAKRMINDSRTHTIVPRIYPVNNISEIEGILSDASVFFKRMHDNMTEAKEALSRPIHRRRRRKAKTGVK